MRNRLTGYPLTLDGMYQPTEGDVQLIVSSLLVTIKRRFCNLVQLGSTFSYDGEAYPGTLT